MQFSLYAGAVGYLRYSSFLDIPLAPSFSAAPTVLWQKVTDALCVVVFFPPPLKDNDEDRDPQKAASGLLNLVEQDHQGALLHR